MVKVLPFYLFTFLPSESAAQTFLDRLQTPVQGQGVVTVHQDSTIDRLVLDPTSTVAPNNNNGNTTTANNGNTTTANNGSTTTANNGSAMVTTTERQARTSRKGVYKVQAYAGGNSRDARKQAQNVGNAIRSRYPHLNVTVHFYSPRWICNVGNFRTYEEAEAMLRNIKGMGYRQALIIKTKK
ncbi:MAG: SPOR domain-containing protein [Prevotella sp.]|nr:SPOR domain-containing protein [Prevotella sp.]